jgi:DNA repair ATPase RecN
MLGHIYRSITHFNNVNARFVVWLAPDLSPSGLTQTVTLGATLSTVTGSTSSCCESAVVQDLGSLLTVANMDTTKNSSLDLNPLMRLKDALEGAQKNTAKMLNKLERFENRLTDLDEKMKPIQTTTKHYTRAKENISLTLAEVHKTNEYFKIPSEVKEIVNMGFTPETQEEFFEALGKLSNAKRFFEAHPEIKSSASMLTTIDGLLAVSVCCAA